MGFLVVVSMAGIGSAAGPVSAHATTPSAVASSSAQSSAYGTGLPTAHITNFTATSSPAGGAPTGQVEFQDGGPGGSHFTGSVTCLSVHGYAATIGATGTVRFGYSGEVHDRSALFSVVDNSAPSGTDGGFILPGSPPDLFGFMYVSAPPNCSINLDTPACMPYSPPFCFRPAPVENGDIVVRDARDKPPRVTVPRTINVAVRRRHRVRVRYRVSVVDDFDSDPSLRCSPRSGARFPVGNTRVVCTARDRSGLRRSAAFRVHVKVRP